MPRPAQFEKKLRSQEMQRRIGLCQHNAIEQRFKQGVGQFRFIDRLAPVQFATGLGTRDMAEQFNRDSWGDAGTRGERGATSVQFAQTLAER